MVCWTCLNFILKEKKNRKSRSNFFILISNGILKGSNRADLFSKLIPISNRSNEIDEYVSI